MIRHLIFFEFPIFSKPQITLKLPKIDNVLLFAFAIHMEIGKSCDSGCEACLFFLEVADNIC